MAATVTIAVSIQAADWSYYLGPNSNFSTDADASYTVVEDLNNAQQVWEGQFRIPFSKTQLGWDNKSVPEHSPPGGGASVIVYDGKVYLSFWVQRGTFDQQTGATGKNVEFVHADDVMICLDAATGRKVWATVMEDKGLNIMLWRKGVQSWTGCAGDGMVYGIGSTYRLYALDANTGDVKWEKGIPGGVNAGLEENKAAGQAKKYSRGFGGNLAYADGVVAASDGGRTMHGFDGQTGTLLWSHEKVLSNELTPAVWYSGKTAYFIVGVDQGYGAPANAPVTCVRAHDGQIMWQVKSNGNNQRDLIIADDHVICRIGDKIGAYRMSPSGATQAWVSEAPAPNDRSGLMEQNGVVWVRSDNALYALRLSDGRTLLKTSNTKDYDGTHQFDEAHGQIVNGRLLLEPDSQHYTSRVWMYLADPENFKTMGNWYQPHAQSSGYNVPFSHPVVDGRIYYRGAEHIYCYDLRKGISTGISEGVHAGADPSNKLSVSANSLLIPQGSQWLSVVDARGRTVVNKAVGTHAARIALPGLSRGRYVVRLTMQQGAILQSTLLFE